MRCWGNDWHGADSFWTTCAPRRVLSVAYHPTSSALQGSQSQPWSLGPRRNSNLLSSPGWPGCDGPSYTPGLYLLTSRLSLPPTPSPSLSYGAIIPHFSFVILDPHPHTPPPILQQAGPSPFHVQVFFQKMHLDPRGVFSGRQSFNIPTFLT